MNEQLKELAFNAGFLIKKNNGDDFRWGYMDPDLGEKITKLAELIVNECMYIGRQAQINNQLVDVEIKEHFGVI